MVHGAETQICDATELQRAVADTFAMAEDAVSMLWTPTKQKLFSVHFGSETSHRGSHLYQTGLFVSPELFDDSSSFLL